MEYHGIDVLDGERRSEYSNVKKTCSWGELTSCPDNIYWLVDMALDRFARQQRFETLFWLCLFASASLP
jgi:hypothetical protein